MSRVDPTKVRDKGHAEDGGKKLAVDLHFQLDLARLTVNGQKKRAVGHVNEQHATGAQESVQGHNPDGSLAQTHSNPNALRPPMPSPATPMAMSANRYLDGLHTLKVSIVEVRQEGPRGSSVEEKQTWAFQPLKKKNGKWIPHPLKPGMSGTFRATIIGSGSMNGWVSQNPGTIQVQEYSPYILRARVRGTACGISGISASNKCPDPKSIDATIVKPFAAAATKQGRFTTRDTPGTKIYRDVKTMWAKKRFGGTIPNFGSRGDSGGSGSGGGSGGATRPTPNGCACTCKEFDSFNALAKKLQSSRKMPSPAMMKKIQSMSMCMQSCAQKYDRCTKR